MVLNQEPVAVFHFCRCFLSKLYFLLICFFLELEWKLHRAKAVQSLMEHDPADKRIIPDAMTSAIRQANYYNDSDSDE